MDNETDLDLIALLDKEKRAIVAADFDALDALLSMKVKLVEAFVAGDPKRGAANAVRAKLSENQNLLTAAIGGVTAARERIAALKDVREGLNVYDQSGRMAQVPTQRSALEKKA